MTWQKKFEFVCLKIFKFCAFFNINMVHKVQYIKSIFCHFMTIIIDPPSVLRKIYFIHSVKTLRHDWERQQLRFSKGQTAFFILTPGRRDRETERRGEEEISKNKVSRPAVSKQDLPFHPYRSRGLCPDTRYFCRLSQISNGDVFRQNYHKTDAGTGPGLRACFPYRFCLCFGKLVHIPQFRNVWKWCFPYGGRKEWCQHREKIKK